MGLAQAWSVALLGVDGVPVEIEAHVGIGLPGFALVGLPDAALHESKERVRAAVLNSGEHWPNRRTTLALSPATLRKVGSSYDLATAVGLLSADGLVPAIAQEVRAVAEEIAADPRYGDDEPLGPDEEARARFREFARKLET